MIDGCYSGPASRGLMGFKIADNTGNQPFPT